MTSLLSCIKNKGRADTFGVPHQASCKNDICTS